MDDELRSQLDAVSAAIGSVRFMDPPDGGSVTLAEQVSRMREELEAATAQIAEWRVALQFYAGAWEDEFSFLGTEPLDRIPTDALREDRGDIARAALDKARTETALEQPKADDSNVNETGA